MATKSKSYKKAKKTTKWQLPLLLILVLVAVGFGVFIVFFSKAGSTSPQVYLATSNTSTVASIPNSGGFTYGSAGDRIIACDWDGVPYGATNGATVAAYRPSNSSFYISNNNASVSADSNLSFQFGNANGGYTPICGNWDGQNPNGQSAATVGLYNSATATFSLASTNTQGGGSVEQFVLGSPGDVPIACDWNGDGITDLGLFRPSEGKFYLAIRYLGKWGVFNSFKFGNAGLTDYPVCGNWTGKASTTTNEFSTIGVYRTTDAKFYLRNSNSEGPADIITSYGTPSDHFVPVTGNWTGTKQTFIGAYRPGNSAPSAPSSLKVNSAATSGINLSWGAASDDGGAVNKYEVYRNGTWWATVNTTSYTDTRGLSAGTSYSYYVVALDNSDTRGPQSNTVTASIPKIAASVDTNKVAEVAVPKVSGSPDIPAGCPGSSKAGPPAPGSCESFARGCIEKNLQTEYYDTLLGQLAASRQSVIETADYVQNLNYNFKYDWYTSFKDTTIRDITQAREQNQIVKAACARGDVYGTLTAMATRKSNAQDAIDRVYLRAQQVCADIISLPRKAAMLLKRNDGI